MLTTTNGSGIEGDHFTDDMASLLGEPPRTLDINIDPPIVLESGATYALLHLEEPIGAQIERAEQELADGVNVLSLCRYQISLISLVSKVPRTAIVKMRISQIEEAANFLASFKATGSQTGAT